MFAPEHRQAAKEKEDFVHEGGVGSEFKPHYLEEAERENLTYEQMDEDEFVFFE